MKTKKLDIPITEDELEKLMNGEDFYWEFNGIEVHLHKAEEGDEE